MTLPKRLLLLVPLCACASSPPALPPKDPQLVADAQAQQQLDANRRGFQQILITLDQALESYAVALNNQGQMRFDKQARSLEQLIGNIVNGDDSAKYGGKSAIMTTYGRNYQRLLATAADDSVPANQGIALAALGFAAGEGALQALLNGVQLQDQRLVDRAVFGIAIKQDPKTPPGVLIKLIDDENLQIESRVQAAWALYRVEEVAENQDPIVEYWTKVLERGLNAMPEGVTAQAVRGLGFTRTDTHAALVARFATHPAARVRIMVAVALARMNAQNQIEALLAMIGPAETNANVRLVARTALRDLAGGTDRGYEVEQWRKVFDRGDK